MGYRTTIEINHDLFPENINGDKLVELLSEIVRTGSARRPVVDRLLSTVGIRVGPTLHSSEPPLFPYSPAPSVPEGES